MADFSTDATGLSGPNVSSTFNPYAGTRRVADEVLVVGFNDAITEVALPAYKEYQISSEVSGINEDFEEGMKLSSREEDALRTFSTKADSLDRLGRSQPYRAKTLYNTLVAQSIASNPKIAREIKARTSGKGAILSDEAAIEEKKYQHHWKSAATMGFDYDTKSGAEAYNAVLLAKTNQDHLKRQYLQGKVELTGADLEGTSTLAITKLRSQFSVSPDMSSEERTIKLEELSQTEARLPLLVQRSAIGYLTPVMGEDSAKASVAQMSEADLKPHMVAMQVELDFYKEQLNGNLDETMSANLDNTLRNTTKTSFAKENPELYRATILSSLAPESAAIEAIVNKTSNDNMDAAIKWIESKSVQIDSASDTIPVKTETQEALTEVISNVIDNPSKLVLSDTKYVSAVYSQVMDALDIMEFKSKDVMAGTADVAIKAVNTPQIFEIYRKKSPSEYREFADKFVSSTSKYREEKLIPDMIEVAGDAVGHVEFKVTSNGSILMSSRNPRNGGVVRDFNEYFSKRTSDMVKSNVTVMGDKSMGAIKDMSAAMFGQAFDLDYKLEKKEGVGEEAGFFSEVGDFIETAVDRTIDLASRAIDDPMAAVDKVVDKLSTSSDYQEAIQSGLDSPVQPVSLTATRDEEHVMGDVATRAASLSSLSQTEVYMLNDGRVIERLKSDENGQKEGWEGDTIRPYTEVTEKANGTTEIQLNIGYGTYIDSYTLKEGQSEDSPEVQKWIGDHKTVKLNGKDIPIDGITEEQVELLLVDRALKERRVFEGHLKKNGIDIPADLLDDLTPVVYQLGGTGLSKFSDFMKYLKAGNYPEAAKQLAIVDEDAEVERESAFIKQAGPRVLRAIQLIASYGDQSSKKEK